MCLSFIFTYKFYLQWYLISLFQFTDYVLFNSLVSNLPDVLKVNYRPQVLHWIIYCPFCESQLNEKCWFWFRISHYTRQSVQNLLYVKMRDLEKQLALYFKQNSSMFTASKIWQNNSFQGQNESCCSRGIYNLWCCIA